MRQKLQNSLTKTCTKVYKRKNANNATMEKYQAFDLKKRNETEEKNISYIHKDNP